VQNPRKILAPYIKEGMRVLDLGCGPGFFSVDLAHMVGRSGRVIASDLQEGMLARLRDKIRNTELADRIILHRCEENKIGLSTPVDFVLTFYMVHEVPDQEQFFVELGAILKPTGLVLIVEPPIHVSRKAFAETINKAQAAGFIPVERPRIFLSKAMVLKKG
jgi:ubiquinone/menaquinone biosynthesis C-methylase UbiE